MLSKPHFVLPFALLSLPASAFNETDLFSDIPEVVSATRISQNLSEVPVSSTVITRELIQASGAINIPELLRLVPGFQVYTANYNKHAVTYHGASGEFPRDLDVRINGRPVYIPLLSTVAWNTLGISVHDVDRIEVVRGSNVPSFGSNALMGAINIITRSPVTSTEKRVNVIAGSQDTRNISSSFSNHHENLYYRASFNHEMNDGFNFQEDGERVNDANVHLVFTPTLFDSVEFSAGFSNGRMGIGQGRNLSDYQDREHRSHFQHLQWSRVTDDAHEINLQLFHNHLKLDTASLLASSILNDPGLTTLNTQLGFLAAAMGGSYPFSSSSVSDFRVPTSAENGSTDTYGAELQFIYSPSEQITVASGLGLRFEQARSYALFNTEETQEEETYFIFSNLEWQQTERLSWNAGFMSELTSITRPATSVRLATNYKLDDQITLRGAVTQAYRTPSLLEANGESAYVFPEGVPYDYISFANDELGAERLRAAELGAFWQLPQLNGYLDMKLFYENLDNGIDSWFYEGPQDLRSIAQGYRDEVRELRNTGERISRGVELQASFKPTTQDLIHLAYSYATLQGIQRRGEIQDKKPDRLYDNRVPQHTLSLLLNHKFNPTLDASLIFTYLSKVQWLDSSLDDDYRTVDFKLSKQFPVGSQQNLTTSLLIKNLLDYHYSEFQLTNDFERRLYLTLTLDF